MRKQKPKRNKKYVPRGVGSYVFNFSQADKDALSRMFAESSLIVESKLHRS